MLELNGVATLSQLCRAYILSISALSGISPTIKLPMINVLSLRKKKNKMSEQWKCKWSPKLSKSNYWQFATVTIHLVPGYDFSCSQQNSIPAKLSPMPGTPRKKTGYELHPVFFKFNFT